MLMKTTVFTFILSLFAFITTNAITPNTLAIEEKKSVGLESENEDDRGKSLVIPFEAWQTDNEEIEIVSYHACTNTTISICTASGQVLDSQTLSFAAMQSVTFNIGNYAEGYYLVKISMPNGTEFSGTFVID